MKTIDIIGLFVSGVLGIAAMSLIFAPRSNVAGVVKALGDSASNLISTAKAYPSGY